ncbi:MAG: glycerol-3-phosphate dehydrogenase C-terminal domain-containing protein [Desulfatiglandaceae bacterium]
MGSSIKGRVKRKNTPFAPFSLLYTMRRNLYSLWVAHKFQASFRSKTVNSRFDPIHRWAARAEAVVHLEDLLLRRTRIGVLLREGGRAFFDRIRAVCQEELGWDDKQWQEELKAYSALWKRCYGAPISPAS